jgi:polyether ionophore transport system permease protein
VTGLTGMPALAKLAWRRDRFGLPAAAYVIVIGLASNAYTFRKLYPTEAKRLSLVTSGASNPALRFLYGRIYGTSLGSLTAWRYAVWAGLFAALMAVIVVIRHTRTDEEQGRLELIGSTAVGRQAALSAALAVSAGACAGVAAVLCVVLPLLGLSAAGSAVLAAAVGACGLAFTGVAGVCAQLVSSARTARGIALAVLGVAFVLRGVGDAAGSGSGLSWLSWVSPLGWVSLVRSFGDPRWWVLIAPLALFLAGVAAAFALAARRDHGAGLFPDRPGRAAASPVLRGVAGLAWRLQWGTLLGWAAGYVFTFAASGAAAQGVSQLFGTSSALRREFTRLGGQQAIVNAYLAALMLLAGLAAGAYAVGAVLRLRTEETGDRAEPVLAGAVGRVRWGLSHLFVAVAGTVVLLAVAGVATGLAYGIRAGGAGPETWRMLGAAMGQVPAALTVAGVAVLIFGLRPEWSVPGSWTVVGVVLLLNLFGQVLQLSHWVMDVSPFTHAPRLPGGAVSAVPLIWLCAVALSCCAAGLAALRRRDLTLFVPYLLGVYRRMGE